MKYLLAIFLILYLPSYSQIGYPVIQNLGSDSTNLRIRGAITALKGMINGVYSDTATANLQRIRQYPYAQIGVNDELWLRSADTSRWILIGSGGGGAANPLAFIDFNIISFDSVEFERQNGGLKYLEFELINPVTTVEGLRNTTLVPSGVVWRTRDFGGGDWLWDPISTLPDNTGTVVKRYDAETGRFLRQFVGPMYMEWFGVVGDGVTINNAAIDSTFSANTARGGGKVEAPAGDIMVNYVFIIPSNTDFEGAGMGETSFKLIDNLSDTETPMSIAYTEDGGTNIRVANMTFDGNRQNQSWTPVGSANYGLGVRSSNTTIVNVEWKNVTANGGGMATDNGSTNVIFDKVYSHGNGKKGFHSGICSDIKIINGYWYDNEEDAGIGIHAGMKNFLVDNNHCYNNRTGIQVGRSVDRPPTGYAIVSNNFIEANEVNGISIGVSYNLNNVDSLDQYVQVIGNHIKNDLIQLTNSSHVSLTGNILTNSYIVVNTSFNISIKGNTIVLDSTLYEAAIQVTGGVFSNNLLSVGDNITVENNTITVGAGVDYAISGALTTNLTIRDNTVIDTAEVYNVRVWSKIGTATIRQIGNGSVRVDAQTFTNGYDNTGITVSTVNPSHGKVGQSFFLTPSNQLRVCGTASTYDANGDLVTPAVWANASPDATETLAGLAEYATQAEVNAGTVNDKIVSPLRFAGRLLGVSGGQSFIGGLDTGDDLFLGATSNGTKTGSRIYFGSGLQSWYDEANLQWGFGVGAGSTNAADKLVVANTSSGAETIAARFENNVSAVNTATSLVFDVSSSIADVAKIRVMYQASDNQSMGFFTRSSSMTEKMRILGDGTIGIGTTAPTGFLHLRAGTTTIPPFKFTTAGDLTTAQAGAMEFGSSRLAFTPSGTTRKRIALTDDVTPTNGQIPIGNGTDFTAAAITAGSGIQVTNGAGSITIANTATPSGFAVINDADYTVAADVKFVLYTTMTAGRTVTLPAVASSTNREITIRNGGNGGFNINLSQTVWSNDASSGTAIIVGEWYTIVSDGVKWWIVAKGT